MIKKIFYLSLIPFLLNCSGCAPLIVGAAVGAVGGYAISRDTIQGDTDKPYESLWNTALELSHLRGQIKYEDFTKGYIELEADASRVYIRLVRLTRSATRVRVSARKHRLPNLTLAQDFFIKILEGAQ